MWSSVLDSVTKAAQQAGKAAAEAAHKAAEMAGGAAEEAGRKLKDLGIETQPAAPPPPSPEDLAAYGITPEFIDFVRTLNYSTFREFPQDQLPPLNAASSSGGGEAHSLNPWQVRHAMLVVRGVKEVDELRFVLCPRYLTDELFWHIYFTLVRKHLPERAYSWGPEDALPLAPSLDGEAGAAGFSFAGLGKQLKQFGSKIHAPSGLPTLELTTFGLGGKGSSSAAGTSGSSQAGAGAAGAAADAAAGAAHGPAVAAAATVPRKPSGLLENDPDLEAYLQVAINDGQEGGDGDDEGSGEELDLDTLMASLEEEGSAEPAEKSGDGGGKVGEGGTQGGGEEAAGAEEGPAEAAGKGAGKDTGKKD